ncbi:hypothetical protein ACH5RR_009044 [Cinchona calisaya]|uniref:Beta-glucosidase n=1 Tax=Cinchona calisaya TaxID=153742 RepID=A0ABD3ADB4_9GENT
MGRLLIGLLVLALFHYCGFMFPQVYGLNTHLLNIENQQLSPSYRINKFNRSSFPHGFIFGAASSAYQVEGGWNADGKGPSIWDHFTHKFPEKIQDHSTGDVAADSYHLYKEDVGLLKKMNMDAYRFSISWSRVLPSIKPVVTLFHWDLPQALEEEYGGFRSHKVINDFHGYANICFERFGDRVKQWITFNEPWSFSIEGYDNGAFAPGRCSSWMNNNCTGGDSSIEPYLVTHNQLLAHAQAVKLYRTKYQAHQKGIIGMTVVAFWMVPLSNSKADKHAAKRAMDFQLGWNMDPLVFGKYPKSMRTLVRHRLPKFTKEQSQLLKGSFDFIGLNYYSAFYVEDASGLKSSNLSFSFDAQANYSIGVDDRDNPSMPRETALKDFFRIKYYYDHLQYLHKAIRAGAKVKGFFGWAVVDNLEWNSGYTVRFGINFVDFKNGMKRYPKLSANWFKKFLQQ